MRWAMLLAASQLFLDKSWKILVRLCCQGVVSKGRQPAEQVRFYFFGVFRATFVRSGRVRTTLSLRAPV